MSDESRTDAISLSHVVKEFGPVRAVDDVSIDIAHGEIVCLLGPSGCGKTTTLRMIAGFDRPTSGEIHVEEKIVSSKAQLVPPEQRKLGMVFQDYAVWPHMTVFRNVAYPLKIKRVSKSTIRKRVNETICLVGLEGLDKRYPEQLSGGQQQRVALARALVAEPVAMLLDEPLSNLDAKLREKMRFEIMDLHRRTGITVVYVTHDQAEAMVLSDRVVVMNLGKIEQTGTPVEIYKQPASPFVADFIGLANFAPARLIKADGDQGVVELQKGRKLQVPCFVPVSQQLAKVSHDGLLFVRPENVDLVSENDAEIGGLVSRRTFLGNQVDYRVEAEGMEWRIEANPEIHFEEGVRVGLRIKQAVFLATRGKAHEHSHE